MRTAHPDSSEQLVRRIETRLRISCESTRLISCVDGCKVENHWSHVCARVLSAYNATLGEANPAFRLLARNLPPAICNTDIARVAVLSHTNGDVTYAALGDLARAGLIKGGPIG